MLADHLQDAIAPLWEKEGEEAPKKGRSLPVGTKRKWKRGWVVKTKRGWRPATRSDKIDDKDEGGGDEGEEEPAADDEGKEGEDGTPDDKAGKGSGGEGKSAEGEGKVKAGFMAKLKEKGGKAARAFKNLPGNGKKFFSDPAYRKEAGKHIAGVFKRKAKGVGKFIKHEIGEFKTAGKALVKIAKREKLTDEDKKALKASAKNIAITVGGTAAMGHFTITALATHWAAETAAKAVGHSALFAHVVGDGDFDLLTEEEQEATLNKFAEFVMKGVAEEFEKFADASPEEAMKLLGKIDTEEAAEAIKKASGKTPKEESVSGLLEQALLG